MITEGNEWVKSSLSFANGNCVEVLFLTTGEVQVRSSRDRDGAVLTYTAAEWEAFLDGARKGEFDLDESGRLARSHA